MRDDGAPRIPIPGTAGEAIRAALNSLAMYPGEMTVTIKKERLPQGGYIYQIAKIQPPDSPATVRS